MHIEALSQTSTRQRITDEELNKKHIEEFSDWYRDYVSVMTHLIHMVNVLLAFCEIIFTIMN